MNYQETIDFLFSQLPMYHRIGASAYKADLNNTIALCKVLNNPQDKFRSIHIAGTNGKGSVSHFIASVLQQNGYKTGLYTSPHLKDYRERIKINGEMIPQEKVTAFVEKYKDAVEQIKPSFFEWSVGLAFNYFAEENVDVAVIETGLGGRLDSTNVITPELSVITNISSDHMNLLGNSLAEIAAEKAGIIKKNIPVVIGQSQPDIASVFTEKAKKENSRIYIADKHFHVLHAEIVYNQSPELMIEFQFKNGIKLNHVFNDDKVIRSPLTGYYQVKNITTVLMALDVMNSIGFTLSPREVTEGFCHVVENTGLSGRWQKLSDKPLVICDIGHNEDGIKEVSRQISFTPHHKLHIVLGFVNDKEIDAILSHLPSNATYYFCKASVPRALDEKLLKEKAEKAGLSGNCFSTVGEAFQSAKSKATADDLIFIGGSTFVVAEVL
jgi:dihydrofolate synthase / folylpolyglutamate synthase